MFIHTEIRKNTLFYIDRVPLEKAFFAHGYA